MLAKSSVHFPIGLSFLKNEFIRYDSNFGYACSKHSPLHLAVPVFRPMVSFHTVKTVILMVQDVFIFFINLISKSGIRTLLVSEIFLYITFYRIIIFQDSDLNLGP